MTELAQLDASLIAEGARLAGVLPYLEEELDKIERRLDMRIYAQLDKDELSPDQALLAWQEKHILKRIRNSFVTKVKMGTSVAERNATSFEWKG